MILGLFNNYKEYLKSEVWQNRRDYFIWGESCNICYSKATLAHHRNYKNVGNEKRKDILPLCHPCHDDLHYNQKNLFTKKRCNINLLYEYINEIEEINKGSHNTN